MHALVWAIWRDHPAPYHALNVLGHAAVTLLLFTVLLRLGNGDRTAALLGALFFGLHPATTETVCWAKSLEDILAGLFLLLAMRTLLRAPRPIRPRTSAVATLLFTLAVCSKVSATFFPIFLLLCELRREKGAPPVSDSDPSQRDYTTPAAMTATAVALLTLRHIILGHTAQGGYLTGSCWTTWLSMPRVILRYLRLEILPSGLLADYQTYPRATHLADPTALVATVALLLIVGAVSLLLYRHKLLPGWVWFLAALLPVANIVPMEQLGADRFLYLPTIGAAILLTQYAAQAQNRVLTLRLAAIFVAALAAYTPIRSRVWRSELSLWQQTLAQSPRNTRARRNLAKALLAEGRGADAVPHLERLAKALPTQQHTMLLGYAHCLAGNVDKGFDLLVDSNSHVVLNDLGAAAAMAGDLPLAQRYFAKAHELAPNKQRYQINLGILRKHQATAKSASPAHSPR